MMRNLIASRGSPLLIGQHPLHGLRFLTLRLRPTPSDVGPVGVMFADVFFLGKQVKVLQAVICALPIYVMNVFGSFQKAAEMLFHYKPMFEHVARRHDMRVFGCVDGDVSIAHHATVRLRKISLLSAVVVPGQIQAWVTTEAVGTRNVQLRDCSPLAASTQAKPMGGVIRRGLNATGLFDYPLMRSAFGETKLMTGDIPQRRTFLGNPLELLTAAACAHKHV